MKQDVPLQEVCIPKYILFTDGLYKYGRTSRTVVYIHQQISVKVRDELQHPDTSTVPLTINRGRKKINLLAFYRQWTSNEPLIEDRRESKKMSNQSDRFSKITDTWST